MKKLNVVYIVNPTFGSVFSGHTHYLFSLLSGWNDDEISMDIFGITIKPLNLNSGDRNYTLPSASLWSSPKRLDRFGRIKWSIELLRMLIKRRKDYDIVHFHSLGWGAFLSPLVLHMLGKKAIFTMSLMGNDNPGYIIQQPRGKLQLSLLRQFDGAIGLSPALVEDAKAHKIKNLICLPNFMVLPSLEEIPDQNRINKTRFEIRHRLSIPQDSEIILFVGSIIYRKGVDVLVEAFISLANRHPQAVLVMVGPNSRQETTSIDEDFVIRMRNKIQTAGLNDRVLWVGMIRDQAVMVDFYRSADIFVLPTRNEGSPNVIAEACFAGLPVVTTFLPGITDVIIQSGKNGILVEIDDTQGLDQAISCLLHDSKMRSDLGNGGRKVALEKFGFESYCQKLKQYYMKIHHENTN